MLTNKKTRRKMSFEFVDQRFNKQGKPIKFLGIRPQGKCHGLNKSDCLNECEWIEPDITENGKEVKSSGYCRSPYGSVSKLVPKGKTLMFVPKGNSCVIYSTEESCDPEHCTWVEGEVHKYCRTKSSKRLTPINKVHANINHYDGNDDNISPRVGNGFYKLPNYSQAQKESWVNPKLTNEDERKFCRCILEVTAKSIFKNGRLTTNPYPICLANKQGRSKEVKSQLAKFARSGQCSTNIVWENVPTEILYSYSLSKQQTTTRGKQYFKQVPPMNEFLRNPEYYRGILLKQINAYNEL